MRPLTAAARRARRRLGLLELRQEPDPYARRLAAAIRAGLVRTADPAAAALLEPLEARRRELMASAEVLEAHGQEVTGRAEDDWVHRRTLAEVCRTDSMPSRWGRILFALVRELRPRAVLELGAAVGLSAAYQAAALAANGHGRLVTIEGIADRVRVARETIAGLGLEDRAEVRHGRFLDLLPAVLDDLAPVELAFVDGHHDERATLRYWELIAPALGNPALVLFDDIRWSRGMTRAWERIGADGRVALALDMGSVGGCACLPAPAGGKRRRIRVPID